MLWNKIAASYENSDGCGKRCRVIIAIWYLAIAMSRQVFEATFRLSR